MNIVPGRYLICRETKCFSSCNRAKSPNRASVCAAIEERPHCRFIFPNRQCVMDAVYRPHLGTNVAFGASGLSKRRRGMPKKSNNMPRLLEHQSGDRDIDGFRHCLVCGDVQKHLVSSQKSRSPRRIIVGVCWHTASLQIAGDHPFPQFNLFVCKQ